MMQGQGVWSLGVGLGFGYLELELEVGRVVGDYVQGPVGWALAVGWLFQEEGEIWEGVGCEGFF